MAPLPKREQVVPTGVDYVPAVPVVRAKPAVQAKPLVRVERGGRGIERVLLPKKIAAPRAVRVRPSVIKTQVQALGHGLSDRSEQGVIVSPATVCSHVVDYSLHGIEWLRSDEVVVV